MRDRPNLQVVCTTPTAHRLRLQVDAASEAMLAGIIMRSTDTSVFFDPNRASTSITGRYVIVALYIGRCIDLRDECCRIAADVKTPGCGIAWTHLD